MQIYVNCDDELMKVNESPCVNMLIRSNFKSNASQSSQRVLFNKTIMSHVPSRPIKKDNVVRNHPFEFISYIYDSTICVHDCMIEEPRLKQMDSMYSLFV